MQNYLDLLMEHFSLEEILAHCIHSILTWPKYYKKAIEHFAAKEKLKFLNVLATNTDGKTEFIAPIAGYKHPVDTIQWYPEKHSVSGSD